MPARFDIESRWPELFESLTEDQRSAVIETLASGWHEGWEPNRTDVADLIDLTRGAIDEHEYTRRTEVAVARAKAHPIAG